MEQDAEYYRNRAVPYRDKVARFKGWIQEREANFLEIQHAFFDILESSPDFAKAGVPVRKARPKEIATIAAGLKSRGREGLAVDFQGVRYPEFALLYGSVGFGGMPVGFFIDFTDIEIGLLCLHNPDGMCEFVRMSPPPQDLPRGPRQPEKN